MLLRRLRCVVWAMRKSGPSYRCGGSPTFTKSSRDATRVGQLEWPETQYLIGQMDFRGMSSQPYTPTLELQALARLRRTTSASSTHTVQHASETSTHTIARYIPLRSPISQIDLANPQCQLPRNSQSPPRCSTVWSKRKAVTTRSSSSRMSRSLSSKPAREPMMRMPTSF